MQVLLVLEVVYEERVTNFFQKGLFYRWLGIRLCFFQFVDDFLSQLKLYAVDKGVVFAESIE